MLASRLKHISAMVAAVRPSSKRVLHVSSRTGSSLIFGRSMPRGTVSLLARSMDFHTSRNVLKVVDDNKDEVAEDTDNHDDESSTEDQEQTEADDDDEEEEEEDEGVASDTYTGVTFHNSRIKKWSASVVVGNIEVDAGQFWTELDAAKGYDELVRMYLEPGAPVNFPDGHADDDDTDSIDAAAPASSHDWTLPDAGSRHADIIPPIPNTLLTLEELLPALEREQAIDVYTIDLAGKSSLASHMVFCTGRSRNHMRRMADLVVQSMKARNMQDDFGYVVEGRDCDDWMITDVNNIVVHFMTAETRQMLALEDHWENMVNDKHRLYGQMSEDDYMDKFGMSPLMTEDDFVHEDSIDHTVWK